MKTRWKVVLALSVVSCIVVTVILTYMIILNLSGSDMQTGGEKVVVIPVKGQITSEGCGSSIFGSTACVSVLSVKQKLRDADADPRVKAVVLEINSGGGAVVPSKELASAVREMNKPVVAYIHESGTSGAYYTASAADYIVANRNAITGGIGVIMTIQHIYGLYDKLGINVTVIKSGNNKDIGSPYREMTEEEKAEFRDMVDKIYADFIWDVAIYRNLSLDYVRNVSDGSLYLGRDAMEMGLVDSNGDLEYAIEKASEIANITGEPTVEKKEKKDFNILDYLFNNIGSDPDSFSYLETENIAVR